MTDAWFWGLLASLILLAIGTSLNAINAAHAKKLSEDECTRLRMRLDVLNDQENKEASDREPIKTLTENHEAERQSKVKADLDVFHGILALIAKYHSQEIPATPRRIATDLGLDPEITLAHMWKYHNEQFISFRNDGKRPELDTLFFLSPKAWEHIKVVPS